MSRRARVIALMAFAVAAMSAWASALGQPQQRVVPPVVLSGPDVGFRVDAYKGDTPVGRLVVRVDGQWVEAQFATGVTRLTTR